MGTPYTVENEAAIDAVADGDLARIYDLSAKGYAYASIAQMRAGLGAVVNTTATTLTITAASHAGKTVRVDSASPIAITLPQATGSGAVYRFQIGTVATATGHTIKVANATDIMQGIVIGLTTSSDNVIGYKATATDDTITVNGTTKGGVVGDWYELRDVKTGFFMVHGVSSPTGSTATPFSATV